MIDLSKLERFLTPDPIDAGCGKTLELLDAYVDILVAGGQPQERYPEIAVHLRDCHPCAQDFEGLLVAARGA